MRIRVALWRSLLALAFAAAMFGVDAWLRQWLMGHHAHKAPVFLLFELVGWLAFAGLAYLVFVFYLVVRDSWRRGLRVKGAKNRSFFAED